MAKFLDQAGLAYFWGKIKSYVGNGSLTLKANNVSVTTFTANQATATSSTLNIKSGDDIAISAVANSSEFTIAHGNTGTGSADSTKKIRKFSYNAQGHVNGVEDITNADLPVPVNDAEFQIRTKVGNTETEVADFTANQSGDVDSVTFVQGDNITLTPNASNQTITISAAGAAAPGDKKLTVSPTSGGTKTQVITMNEGSNDKNLAIVGGTDLTSAVTTGTNEVTVTINHDTFSTTDTTNSATVNNYVAEGQLVEKIAFTVSNGHVTAINPTYRKINYATESTSGLMSAEDKKTLNQINQTIANALTSAITPKGGITPYELQQAVSAQETILSAAHVGDLYRLIDEDDTTDPNYGKPLAIGNTQSNDIAITYNNFVEGSSMTNNGTQRHEFPAGTYVMVVNTGTAQNPVYKLDAVSGLYDMSNYWTNDDLKPIPLNTSDSNYDGPTTTADPTIDSICV